jgi:hypothetical protein
MWRSPKRGAGFHLGQRGQALVEFAFVFPILLFVLFATVDFGVGLTRWISITNAAREATRLGAVGADVDAIRQKAIDTSDGILADGLISVTYADVDGGDIGPGDSVVVDVEYEYNMITPVGRILGNIPALDSITLSACSDMRLEQVSDTVPIGSSGCD